MGRDFGGKPPLQALGRLGQSLLGQGQGRLILPQGLHPAVFFLPSPFQGLPAAQSLQPFLFSAQCLIQCQEAAVDALERFFRLLPGQGETVGNFCMHHGCGHGGELLQVALGQILLVPQDRQPVPALQDLTAQLLHFLRSMSFAEECPLVFQPLELLLQLRLPVEPFPLFPGIPLQGIPIGSGLGLPLVRRSAAVGNGQGLLPFLFLSSHQERGPQQQRPQAKGHQGRNQISKGQQHPDAHRHGKARQDHQTPKALAHNGLIGFPVGLGPVHGLPGRETQENLRLLGRLRGQILPPPVLFRLSAGSFVGF